MKLRTTALLFAGAALILDSRCAAEAASDALRLCAQVLIPSLFPLLVVSGMLVPNLKGLHLPFLSNLIGMPVGSEGLFLLGCVGGFPVGAASVAQAAGDSALGRREAERMLGLCSFCGPAFLFGILPQILPMPQVITIFILQLETGLLLSAFWPGNNPDAISCTGESVSVPEAVRKAVNSMLSICTWVVLAGVAAGFLRHWLFPLLPNELSILLTGLLELTTGISALPVKDPSQTFLLCTVFVCFGGISVLLQISGLAASAGLRMGPCIVQKTIHGLLGAVAAAGYLKFGHWFLLVPPSLLLVKMILEIPGRMVYNDPRKEGI